MTFIAHFTFITKLNLKSIWKQRRMQMIRQILQNSGERSVVRCNDSNKSLQNSLTSFVRLNPLWEPPRGSNSLNSESLISRLKICRKNSSGSTEDLKFHDVFQLPVGDSAPGKSVAVPKLSYCFLLPESLNTCTSKYKSNNVHHITEDTDFQSGLYFICFRNFLKLFLSIRIIFIGIRMILLS